MSFWRIILLLFYICILWCYSAGCVFFLYFTPATTTDIEGVSCIMNYYVTWVNNFIYFSFNQTILFIVRLLLYFTTLGWSFLFKIFQRNFISYKISFFTCIKYAWIILLLLYGHHNLMLWNAVIITNILLDAVIYFDV